MIGEGRRILLVGDGDAWPWKFEPWALGRRRGVEKKAPLQGS